MSAYALAHTVTQGSNRRRRLGNVFDGMIDRQNGLDPEQKSKIHESRRKVDRLYDSTRAQIAAMSRVGSRPDRERPQDSEN